MPGDEEETGILSDPSSTFFNRQPNEFLTRVAATLPKGRALDVGMGQGRNAVWLATQGWQVTGFDDWRRGSWDLILMSYVDVRSNARRAIDALAPVGVVIVEGTHRDTLKLGVRIGEAVLFGDNELLQLFPGLRVLQYEDVTAPSDFGEPELRGRARTVRLLAQKPGR